MQTRRATLLLVAIDPSVERMVSEAARLVFTSVEEVTLPGLEQALQRETRVPDEILVLLDPGLGDVDAAKKTVDAHGLSRWPIVVLTTAPGEEDGELEYLPREIWSPQVLGRALHAAVLRHDLRRENQRARGDMLTMARRITHDLRSPLSGVVSIGEMLKEMLAEHDPQSAGLADPLFRSTDGLVKLIERVGLLLGSTAQQPPAQKVEMGTAVGNALQRLERLAAEKKVKIQRATNWPDLQAVEAWIEIIWWNLVRNALQHADGLTRIELGWDQREGPCRFWVRDDGKGIPPERRKRLFQPFHTLHEPGAARGLGLATVQRLVELQGGVCGYEPREGGGSSFSFTLPQGGNKSAVDHHEDRTISVAPPKVTSSAGDAEAQQNAERLGLALDAAKLGGWVWNAGTDMITFSGRGAEIFGTGANPHMTRSELRDLLHEDDRKLALAANQTAVANKTDYDIEYRLKRPSGEWCWVAAKGRGTYDAAGNLTGMLGVVQDITARKRSEEALRKQNERLLLLSDALGQLLEAKNPKQIVRDLLPKVAAHLNTESYFNYLVNAAGDALEMNACAGVSEEVAHRIHRLDFGQAICGTVALTRQPIHATDIQHSGYDKASLVRSFGIQAYACHPFVVEGQFLGTLSFASRARVRFDEDELDFMRTISQYVALALDRARSEQDNSRLYSTLQSNERQLQMVADHAPVSLAHVDRAHRYKFVNRAYAVRFACPVEQIIGRHISEVLGAEAYETALPHINAVLGGRQVAYEMEMQTGDEKGHWMSVVYVPERTHDGTVVGFVAMSSDITSRKHAEQQAELARDKALAASRAKDDFLAALSHELRTPLNPVLLLASESAENPKLSAEVRADFATIRKNVELEARLIDDLLDPTRITRGKLFLELGSLDVHAVMKDAITAVRAQLEEKKIIFKLNLKAQPHVVLGDAVRLQQVFWNVLNNAVKFTPPGGAVAVETSASAGAGVLAVRISDSGVGMTAEELAKVFNAFSQGEHADDGGSHRFGGLGLGLAISRMLVEQHSGTIRAESPGRDQGATFIIELPLQRFSSATAGVPSVVSNAPALGTSFAAPQSLRILLVEDHDATRVALVQLLERRHFQVFSAGSMAEARDLAQKEKFHLLISDIGLPDGNGCDLMTEMRASQGLVGIALTGYGMEGDVARSRNAGFATHLIKPLSVQALEKAIETVMAGAGK